MIIYLKNVPVKHDLYCLVGAGTIYNSKSQVGVRLNLGTYYRV